MFLVAWKRANALDVLDAINTLVNSRRARE